MRVVAGSARGRRLAVPDGKSPGTAEVRPTSDRVREAVFNALGSIDAISGARVLDLFAGSGALAIEALSRGASTAVLVDRDRAAIDVIHRNLAATELAAQAEVVRADATSYLATERIGFGLVLLDPPYRYDEWDELLAALESVVTAATVVVIESDREVEVPLAWSVERRKRYGSTFVAIVRPPEPRVPSQPPSRG